MNINFVLENPGRIVSQPISHPLLLVGVDKKEAFINQLEEGRWKDIFRKKLEVCDKALGKSIPSIPRSLYDDFGRTGRREPFERNYLWRRRMVEDLAIVYLLTGEHKYLDLCRDFIWAIMEEFTWVLPAHVKEPLDPDSVVNIDLFSSGTALLLADLYDLFHRDLDSETLKWMRYSILSRVLIPLRDHYFEQRWAKRYESNWCGVCSGNSGCALILTALDEPWAKDLLCKLLRSIDGFLSTVDPDGAWVEGVEYWFYGFSRVVYLSDLLEKVTDGKLDLLEDSRIRAVSTFPVWTYLPPCFQVNFGDTGRRPENILRWEITSRC